MSQLLSEPSEVDQFIQMGHLLEMLILILLEHSPGSPELTSINSQHEHRTNRDQRQDQRIAHVQKAIFDLSVLTLRTGDKPIHDFAPHTSFVRQRQKARPGAL